VNWQYKTIVLPSSEQRENMLTEMGLNGWELVGFEQGLAYFKRPKSEVSEAILQSFRRWQNRSASRL
jgi:hypothetical protein